MIIAVFWFFYNVLFIPLVLVMLPHYLLRMRRRGGYSRHFCQRLGCFAPEIKARLCPGTRIWVHAVSVGEVGVALSLIEQWRQRDPAVKFILSLNTSTGRSVAEKRIHPDDLILYAPVDFPWTVAKVLNLVRPLRFVLVESEFWPNLLRGCHRRRIPVALINGRISDRSFPRYLQFSFFTRRLLPWLEPVLTQSDIDRDRLLALGARHEVTRSMGSAKYDLPSLDATKTKEAQKALQAAGFPDGATILMGGSTWPGEETMLVHAYQHLKDQFPALRLILAPRHFERQEEIKTLLREKKISFASRIGSENAPGPAEVFLLNTTGELTAFYANAHVVFVGKSMQPEARGGQNFIEPAALGKTVVVGPYLENFKRIAEEFAAKACFIQVSDERGLEEAIRSLLEGNHKEMGKKAAQLVAENAGALTRSLEILRASVPT